MPPEPPNLTRLRRSNFSSRAYTFKSSRYPTPPPPHPYVVIKCTMDGWIKSNSTMMLRRLWSESGKVHLVHLRHQLCNAICSQRPSNALEHL